jgi:hypothetical protein
VRASGTDAGPLVGRGADRAEPPATPNQIAWLESGLAALGGTGLSEPERLSIILLVGGFARREATLVTDGNAAFRATGATPVQAVARYGRLLVDLTSPDDFPALHAVIEARANRAPGTGHDAYPTGPDRIISTQASTTPGP